MDTSETPDSLPKGNETDGFVREDLAGDDTSGGAESEEALVDGDTIGAALREES